MDLEAESYWLAEREQHEADYAAAMEELERLEVDTAWRAIPDGFCTASQRQGLYKFLLQSRVKVKSLIHALTVRQAADLLRILIAAGHAEASRVEAEADPIIEAAMMG